MSNRFQYHFIICFMLFTTACGLCFWPMLLTMPYALCFVLFIRLFGYVALLVSGAFYAFCLCFLLT